MLCLLEAHWQPRPCRPVPVEGLAHTELSIAAASSTNWVTYLTSHQRNPDVCGICGRFSVDPVSPAVEMWEAILDGMWRRGPDDRGLVYDEHCVIGCRRLAILDQSRAGHLPMEADGGRFWLALNGEVYNFRELRATLKSAGFQFRSGGDSEVVLRAMQHWDVDALNRFNGMFALAFYDREARSLVLARDHAGIKPLYVLDDDRGVVFASQFDQLMTHPWAEHRSADPDAVAMYLRLGHIPAPRAYLQGTRMLEPGSWFRFDARGHCESERYFRFASTHTHTRPTQEQVNETVRTAVARQAVSDVPVGSFLSGGIDSPLLAAHLAELSDRPIPTFSVEFEEPTLDESEDAARYATKIGTNHHVRLLTEAQVPGLFEEAVAASHEPLADVGILPSLVVSRLASEHVKVALSGEGGDELFWGYYARHSAMLRRESPPDEDRGVHYFSFFAEFRREQFSACFPALPWWPEGERGYDFRSKGSTETGTALRTCEFEAYLPFILLKTDRASMHHSLEVRVPLLDREVIDMAHGLTTADCLDLRRGIGKLPLRRALRRQVHFETTGKRGFTAPIGAWVRTALQERVRESLRTLRGLETIDVDEKALLVLFQNHLVGTSDNGMALWRILCLDQWLATATGASRRWVASRAC